MERRRPRNIPARPLVLIADDDDETRELYVASLAAFGFETMPVAGCADAFRQAWESHPDAVVADLPLRGVEGWQLVQRLKREARTRDIPVVLLSGHTAPSIRERAVREGCAAYFVKPCLPDDLAFVLRLVLDRSAVDAGVPAAD